ncbi:MAG TPA: YebC/PmpR family DNA-binding transcriptional regulator [Flavobacteriales bacterium]|nr:YebC/PmpR family DNA-binding transcriptional regulator [Flavobacteriales bacterium]HIN39445.1 YebC/PmpR family DNA-binding transcriptional regulator [Flavobacteriales bacterium]
MSGHSKWSTIKRKKGATDAKRSKAFSRVIKEISVAVKNGGGIDPKSNPALRMAISNAKGVNMPKDNIERAINKASDTDGNKLSEITYEGYGPHGVAIFLECTTDNLKRTVSNVRAAFTRSGGALGTNGSLEFLFDRKGVFTVPTLDLAEDEFTLEVIDGGAEEVEKVDEVFIVYTSFEDFGTMQKKLEDMGIQPENAELQRVPAVFKAIRVADAKKVLKVIDLFEEDEDVQNVFHNLEITDDLLNEME